MKRITGLSFQTNPNGNLWASDESTFGQKMLAKMGWTKGQGLGRNNQGITTAVKVSRKSDTRGVGCSKLWAEEGSKQMDAFADVLASLNEQIGSPSGEEKDNQESDPVSLERTSRDSRHRLHYTKFTRGKDLTRYSDADLKCIVGARGASMSKENIADDVQSSKKGMNDESSAQCRHVNSSLSITDYFKQKMEALRSGMQHSNSAPQLVTDDGCASDEEDFRPSFGGLGGTVNQWNLPSESSARPSFFIGETGREEASNSDDCPISMAVETENTLQIEDEHNSDDGKKRKKKKKKERKRRHSESLDLTEDIETGKISEGPTVHDDLLPRKEKRRKRRLEDEVCDANEGERLMDSAGPCDDSSQSKKKRKKDKRKETEDNVVQDAVSDELRNECNCNSEDSEEKPKRKRRKKRVTEQDFEDCDQDMIPNEPCIETASNVEPREDESSKRKRKKKKKEKEIDDAHVQEVLVEELVEVLVEELVEELVEGLVDNEEAKIAASDDASRRKRKKKKQKERDARDDNVHEISDSAITEAKNESECDAVPSEYERRSKKQRERKRRQKDTSSSHPCEGQEADAESNSKPRKVPSTFAVEYMTEAEKEAFFRKNKPVNESVEFSVFSTSNLNSILGYRYLKG